MVERLFKPELPRQRRRIVVVDGLIKAVKILWDVTLD